MRMATLTVGELEIPFEVHTLEGFRTWAATREGGPPVSFCLGDVFVDVNQSYRTHEPVVQEINAVLGGLARDAGVGRYFTPPSWFTCVAAQLSTEPDGFFARYETLQRGDLRLHPDRDNEMLGRPDFVLEVVSPCSRRKDLVKLLSGYARAGVAEYWVIDARRDELDFHLFDLTGGASREVPPDAEGWRTSPLWGRAFRLRRQIDPAGLPEFRLDAVVPR